MTAARTREAGFGLVEVIIAALLLTFIASTAALLLASSGRSLRTADLHRMRAEVARAAVDHLSQSQEWGNSIPACRSSAIQGRPACDVSHLIAGQPWLTQQIAGRDVRFRVRASAQGVDAPIDGVGAADRDRRVPDWFELRVVVEGGSAQRPLVLEASTDSATRGTGGLVLVRACAAPEQADDRIEPGTCDRPFDIPMPAPGGVGPSVDRDLVSYAVAPAWTKQVRVQPIAVSCVLTGPDGTRQLRTSTSGSWFSPAGLTPGTWRLRCAPPAGFEAWPRQTQPVDGALNVQEGRTTTAFVMYRRPPVSVMIRQGTIHYHRYQTCSRVRCVGPFSHSTFARRFEQYERHELQIPVQPIPSPYGRQPLPGAVQGASGVRTMLPPGLYGNTVMAGNEQYYLYTGTRTRNALGVEFGAPISWFYVYPNGRVETGPADTDSSGLWLMRWYCHFGDNPVQMPCPEGRVPQGRGPLQLGGSGGRGGG